MAEQSHSSGRIFVFGEREPESLLVEIMIDCPECGPQRYRIAGHHLRMVRDLCIDAIDQYPELTGNEPRRISHMVIKGQTNDPSTS